MCHFENETAKGFPPQKHLAVPPPVCACARELRGGKRKVNENSQNVSKYNCNKKKHCDRIFGVTLPPLNQGHEAVRKPRRKNVKEKMENRLNFERAFCCTRFSFRSLVIRIDNKA